MSSEEIKLFKEIVETVDRLTEAVRLTTLRLLTLEKMMNEFNPKFRLGDFPNRILQDIERKG